MPNYISQWKINNQLADLQDGTRGLPGGAVPLDANGKIAYNLLKARANQIPTARDNSDSLTRWASKVACNTVLPTTWTKSTVSGATFSKIEFVNGVFIAVGNSGIRYSAYGASWTLTNISSFSGQVTVEFIAYLGNAYFVGTSSGLWRSTNLSTWTKVFDYSVTSIAYDGTRYELTGDYNSVFLWESADGISWSADTFFSGLDSNFTPDVYSLVFYVNGVWFISAKLNSTVWLWAYDGSTFNTIIGSNGKYWSKITYVTSQDIDGLLNGPVWIAISKETSSGNSSKVLCSEQLFNTQWRQSYLYQAVVTDFVIHNKKLFIGDTSGIEEFVPTGTYYFTHRRLSDYIGSSLYALGKVGRILVACGLSKVLFAIDPDRWYRGLKSMTCYSMACGNNKVAVSAYSSATNNTIMWADAITPDPLYL